MKSFIFLFSLFLIANPFAYDEWQCSNEKNRMLRSIVDDVVGQYKQKPEIFIHMTAHSGLVERDFYPFGTAESYLFDSQEYRRHLGIVLNTVTYQARLRNSLTELFCPFAPPHCLEKLKRWRRAVRFYTENAKSGSERRGLTKFLGLINQEIKRRQGSQ